MTWPGLVLFSASPERGREASWYAFQRKTLERSRVETAEIETKPAMREVAGEDIVDRLQSRFIFGLFFFGVFFFCKRLGYANNKGGVVLLTTVQIDNGKERAKPARLKIREMEIDDLAGVFHMGEKLFEAQSLKNLYRTWDEFEVVDLYLGDSEFCLVAELDDELVGFALGTTITKSRSAWKYGHLVWLGVAPGHQRAGIAEKLFHRFRAKMIDEGVRMMIVDSQAENVVGLRFFAKMGFSHPIEHIYLSMNLSESPKQKGFSKTKNAVDSARKKRAAREKRKPEDQ